MAYTGNSIVDYLNSIGQNSSYSNRATLAQQYGISGYQGTSQQNTSLLNYLRGQGTNTQTGTTPQNNTVDANQLGTSQPFNIPPAQQGYDYNSLVASFNQPVQDAQIGYDTAQNTVNTNQSELINLSKMLEGQTGAQQQAENQVGIPQINKDLLELQNQARQKNLEYQQAFTNVEGQKVPLGVVVGQQAQLQRQQAIDIAIANSNIQAKQGQLSLAQDSVDRAIKAQFEPIYARIETQKLILQQNYENLSSAQKKLADAKQTQLDLKMRQLEKQENEAKEINSIRLEAVKNGATNDVISALSKAKTVEEAIRVGARFMSDPLDRQMKMEQIKTEKLQQQKLSSEINPNPISDVQNEDLNAYASQFSDTGKLPTPSELKQSGLTVGQVTAYAKQMPRPSGTVVSSSTGVKSNSVGAGVEQDFTKLYNITKLTNQLLELDKKRTGGLFAGTLGKIFGGTPQGEAQGDYLTVRKSIVDEISRMQSGAALTKDEVAYYEDYLPGRYSEPFGLGQNSDKKIQNFAKVMNEKLANGLINNNLSIYGYSKVNVGGQQRTVGEIIDIGGQQYRVLPDGTLTDVI